MTDKLENEVDNKGEGQEEILACVDVRLPLSMLDEALQVAHEENPENPDPAKLSSGEKAAIVTAKKWMPGRTLRVRFLGGQDAIREKVENYAHQWSDHASITFQFGDDPDAEIRVAFLSGQGSWSYLGTDNLVIPKDRPTMNFGWLRADSTDDEYSRVVLHEFGHALGLMHEHSQPAANIPWDKDAVYRYYQGPPNNWSRSQVDNNLFARYSADQSQFSAFDKDSIMLYPIPRQFTTGGFEVGLNKKLSQTDKDFIASMYPR